MTILGDCDTIKKLKWHQRIFEWNDSDEEPCCLGNWSLNLRKNGKKNVNRAETIQASKIDIFWKKLSVALNMKETYKKVEKATKAVAREVKQAASSVEEFAASLEGVAWSVRKHSMMKVFALLRTTNWTEKRVVV